MFAPQKGSKGSPPWQSMPPGVPGFPGPQKGPPKGKGKKGGRFAPRGPQRPIMWTDLDQVHYAQHEYYESEAMEVDPTQSHDQSMSQEGAGSAHYALAQGYQSYQGSHNNACDI